MSYKNRREKVQRGTMPRQWTSPEYSWVVGCSAGYARGYRVALGRPPRRIVKYACSGLGRAPCLHGVSDAAADNSWI